MLTCFSPYPIFRIRIRSRSVFTLDLFILFARNAKPESEVWRERVSRGVQLWPGFWVLSCS